MVNGRCNWPRGKVIGGSSVLNYMLYLRGNRKDYDTWEEQGNPGWGFQDVLHYFKKSEDNKNPYLVQTPYHASDGYLTVQEAPWHTPLVTAFVQAGQEMGYENRDINGEYQTGFMIAQGTIRRGSRCSSAKAFLRPARLRKNLHVAMHAHATKVLIHPKSKRAYGMEFARNGKMFRIRVKKEVIVSGGAINSPQLLMLSGIGPKEHLQEFGIPVIQDSKVSVEILLFQIFRCLDLYTVNHLYRQTDRSHLSIIEIIPRYCIDFCAASTYNIYVSNKILGRLQSPRSRWSRRTRVHRESTDLYGAESATKFSGGDTVRCAGRRASNGFRRRRGPRLC